MGADKMDYWMLVKNSHALCQRNSSITRLLKSAFIRFAVVKKCQ